jgi:hypothetical protein
MQFDSNDERSEVVLHEFKNCAGLLDIRIVAKCGAICLKKEAGQHQSSITLLSAGQFLNKCSEGSNFASITLNGQDLSNVEMNDADFKNATLNKVNFSNANIKGADFTGAKLNDVTLIGARLDGAILTDTKITLSFPVSWDTATLQSFFCRTKNGLKNGPCNLFGTIMSLDRKYNELKISLIHQVIDSLKKVDVSCIKDDLVFLVMDSIYWRDDKINAFKLSLA